MKSGTQYGRSTYPLGHPNISRAQPHPVWLPIRFWRRISDGMALDELWKQLRADARSSYRLYSREVESADTPGTQKPHHFLHAAEQLCWAILEKLTPARRVVLVASLVMIVVPTWLEFWTHGGDTSLSFDVRVLGGLLMFGLLVFELTDRVIMKRDLQIAREIQTWLLPARPPQVPGVAIAFSTRPANTVAGDYYDVFAYPESEPPNEKFLIAVADVAGKSVPAAMLMATIQASLKTLCTMPGPLTTLVCRMNRYACSNSQNGRRFTTAFIAEYDPGSRVLTYVNAGHNAPILRRRSGALEMLEEGGLPLGVMDAVFASGSVTLEHGDWLVVFTDGVVEAENVRKEEYGEARLIALLEGIAGLSPDAVMRRILLDVDQFVGTAPQHDDLTLLLLRVD
jgi:phosphoserine phosphatase RsbU/P